MARYKFKNPNLSGYFYDTNTELVYSTKRAKAHTADAYPLTWSKPNTTGNRLVQLRTVDGAKVAMYQSEIDWNIDTTSSIPVTDSSVNTSTTDTYVVVELITGKSVIEQELRRFCTFEDAIKSAGQLAKATPGTQFRVYKDCGTVRCDGLVWS